MLIRLGELQTFSARVDDDDAAITDVFLNIGSGKVMYLLLDTGSWLARNFTLVHVGQIAAVSVPQRLVRLKIDRAALEVSPTFTADALGFLDQMPPVLIGPFGGMVSPMAMATAVPKEARPDDQTARSVEAVFNRFSHLSGIEAFGKDGPLGTVEDLVLCLENYEITHLAIGNPKLPGVGQAIIPFSRLRHMADQETHLVFDLTGDELRSAPHLHRSTPISRDRLDAPEHP